MNIHSPIPLALVWISIAASLSTPVYAEQTPNKHRVHGHAARGTNIPQAPKESSSTTTDGMNMSMGPMQGGKAPPDARDPNAYAEGFESTPMPASEQTDRLPVGRVLWEQLEFVSQDEGNGGTWDLQAWHGPDEQKLWLRTEGSASNGSVGSTTDAEVLWWRALAPFWATQLGVRQDFGAGAHSYAAFGLQGLAPYWYDIEATGYVGEDGRLSARFKASYDLLFTNRLILAPKIESNLYSKAEPKRDLGSGIGNVELGVRLRYEVTRKFAPYLGVVWERALGDTADRLRADGKAVTDTQIVAGIRAWW